jgi:DNA-binding IscR family transcriptional regulator
MDAQMIALHVLRAVAEAQVDGRRIDLENLVEAVQVRRRDLRSTVSALHRAGLVDALRMRPTMKGFALGIALAREPLPGLRPARSAATAAA